MPPKSLYRFVADYSLRGQLLMVAVTCLSFPVAYLALELPKLIIDDAIGGADFPRAVLGFELEQVEYLFLLCFIFLSLFFVSNGIKYTLNMLRGRTGERLLRRLRYMLIERFLRLRRGDERHYTAGEVVQMVAAEVQPLGNFAGDFFATPLMQTGTLVVLLGFIFVQDPALGLAAVALLPVQAYVIPQLQKRVVRLQRERIKNVRVLSEEIGESVGGLETIRSYDVIRWRLAQLSDRLFQNFDLRLQIFHQKFLIKFTNNVLNQISPFAFYAIGGYYVIQGDLEIGALVAVIAAHKDLQAPVKELLRYYQDFSDITARYEALIERFALGDTMDEEQREDRLRDEPPELQLRNLRDENGGPIQTPDRVGVGETVRIVGGDEPQRAALVAQLAGAFPPDAGEIQLNGSRVNDLSRAARANAIAVVGRTPAFFRGSIRDNLALALINPPDAGATLADRRHLEARETGNLAVAEATEWIDPTLAGLDSRGALDDWLLGMAAQIEVFDPIFDAGVNSVIDPDAKPDLVAQVLTMRADLRGEAGGLTDVVEFWDPERYNDNAPLIDNLLFAAPPGPPKTAADVAEDRTIRAALRGKPLETTLLTIGAEIIEETSDLLIALGSEASALRDFDLYPPDLVTEYSAAAQAHRRGRGVSRTQARRLLHVAFGFTPARHRLGALDDARRDAIVAARAEFSALPKFRRFGEDVYLPSLSLRENILLGRPRLTRRDQWPRIGARLRALATEGDAADAIARLGLDAEMSGRDNPFTPDHKLRFAVARALAGRPRMLLLDGPGGSVSAPDRRILEAVERIKGDAILIYTSTAPVDPTSDEKLIRIRDDLGDSPATGSGRPTEPDEPTPSAPEDTAAD